MWSDIQNVTAATTQDKRVESQGKISVAKYKHTLPGENIGNFLCTGPNLLVFTLFKKAFETF
jgi:hypothetical protein